MASDPQTNERADLIERLRDQAAIYDTFRNQGLPTWVGDSLREAADALEADRALRAAEVPEAPDDGPNIYALSDTMRNLVSESVGNRSMFARQESRIAALERKVEALSEALPSVNELLTGRIEAMERRVEALEFAVHALSGPPPEPQLVSGGHCALCGELVASLRPHYCLRQQTGYTPESNT